MSVNPNISQKYIKSEQPTETLEKSQIPQPTSMYGTKTIENKKDKKCEMDVDYDADVDEDVAPVVQKTVAPTVPSKASEEKDKVLSEKSHIYQLFQPWAIKTYGDHSKTKTITIRKKVRILKTLEGKEHSRPDSSKFRFWVKTKGFTTRRPENFIDAPCMQRRLKPLPPNAVLSDNPADVDLYVASTSKDLSKRHYRKVAVVEEFFDIIYNVHMELGGRSGLHAGQKRTYRIISETYAFLPREAVTRFLTICPECKKNLRAYSPSSVGHKREDITTLNESSSDLEALNYSSQTESSVEVGPATKISTKSTEVLNMKRRYSNPCSSLAPTEELGFGQQTDAGRNLKPSLGYTPSTQMPKINFNPYLQRPFTESSGLTHYPYTLSLHSMKSHDNLERYYDFMRRLYSSNLVVPAAQSSHTADCFNPIPSKVTSKNPLPKPLEKSISSSSDDESDNITVLNPKRFKSSHEDPVKLKNIETPLKIPQLEKAGHSLQAFQNCSINLSKSNLSTFRIKSTPTTPKFADFNTVTKSSSTLLTSTPTTVKVETQVTPNTITPVLRIPQTCSTSVLPILNFERLKPITSTYLQLTRSMGLSDEEALRFDQFVSNDFTYTI